MKNLRMATRPPNHGRPVQPESGWRGPRLRARSNSNYRRVLQRDRWTARLLFPAAIAASLLGAGLFYDSPTGILLLPFALVATYGFLQGKKTLVGFLGWLLMVGTVLIVFARAG